jgi:hypothetical protein
MEFMLKVLAIIFVSVVALGCSSSKVEYGLYSWEMLRDYFRYFKEAGFYGRVPLAIYTGTNAMYELSISEEPADRQMYREFCEFVVNNKF